MAPMTDAGRRPPSVYQVWSSYRPCHSEDMAHDVSALMGRWPWPLTFWPRNWYASHI